MPVEHASETDVSLSLKFCRSENVALIPSLYEGPKEHTLQSYKVRRPETRHLSSRKSANIEREVKLAGRTGSHPVVASNPLVPQPGLDPDMMSLKPLLSIVYSQGLRKPSGGLPVESRKSLRSEIMPATVCTSAVS